MSRSRANVSVLPLWKRGIEGDIALSFDDRCRKSSPTLLYERRGHSVGAGLTATEVAQAPRRESRMVSASRGHFSSRSVVGRGQARSYSGGVLA